MDTIDPEEIFILRHATRWNDKNLGAFRDFQTAKEKLHQTLDGMISEDNKSVVVKTPENTQPWYWKQIIYAVDLNQFTAEAGDVPDWFAIEKWQLV